MAKDSACGLHLAAAATLMLSVVALVLASACSSGDETANSTLTPTPGALVSVTPVASQVPAGSDPVQATPAPEVSTPTPAAPTPTPVPQGPPAEPSTPPDQSLPSVNASDRFLIARLGIDAPLSFKVVGADARLPNPDGPDDVAYYNFSAWPGYGGAPGVGGNTVLSGHVDSGVAACKGGTVAPPCTAVMWDLDKLVIGDEITVRIDGVSYVYTVTSNDAYDETTNWAPIFAATREETLTVVTCSGDFNPQSRSYNMRQVVKARRTAP